MTRGIVAAIAAVAVFAMTLGVSYPLLALILERGGMSETLIGLNAAMAPLGILVSAPLIPWAAARMNAVALAISAGVATAGLIGAFAVVTDPLWWFPLRFALGISINVLFVLSETWINQLAPAAIRGRIVGIYATVLSAGFALGPFAVGLFGTEGFASFALAIAGALVTVPVLYAARAHLPPFPGGTAGNLWSFARAAPLLLAVCGAVALFDQTTLSLMPIYALRSGLDEAGAAVATGTLVAGNMLFQIPIGWLADHLSRRLLIALLTALVIGCAALLPAVAGTRWLWPLLIAWGAVGYGAYTVTLAELGTGFSGALLLAGNAVFSIMWGIGGIVGPAAAGAAMDRIGANGLPLVLAIVFATLLIALVLAPLIRESPQASPQVSARSAERVRR